MSQRISASQMLKPMAAGLALAVALGGFVGCKKDEPPPPLPSAAPAATPTPTTPVELVPEDAGVVDAGEDAGPKKGTGVAAPGLRQCCAALSQNAKSAPPPNNQYMEAAALVCNAAASAGQTQGAAMAAIRAALRGAGMPAGCQ